MKLKNRTILERITGKLEGLVFGFKNDKLSAALLDIAESIDAVIKDESDGDTE